MTTHDITLLCPQVEELYLQFARKASAFNSWMEGAEEDLTDPVRCTSQEEIKVGMLRHTQDTELLGECTSLIHSCLHVSIHPCTHTSFTRTSVVIRPSYLASPHTHMFYHMPPSSLTGSP